jgi:uncharacterized membrane protein YedE/YeeE
MSFERILLGVLAAFVLLAGAGCLVAPSLFAQQAQFQTNPSALTEIRAFYGGLQFGIGLFLVWCLRTPSRTYQGLLLAGLAVGGTGLARIFGILFDHVPTSHHLANLGIELVTVVLVAIALSMIRRQPTGAAV